MAEFEETDIEKGRYTTAQLESRRANTIVSGTVWKTLSTALSGDEYVSRTKSYYEFMAGVSGLLAGFTYITTSEDPALTGFEREVYGIVGVSGFVSALIATVTSIILWVALTILGPEGAVFFGEKFSRYHNLPAVFTVLAFILMATSIMLSVQGYYAWTTSLISYIMVGSAMVSTFVFYFYVRITSTIHAKTYWRKHPSQRNINLLPSDYHT